MPQETQPGRAVGVRLWSVVAGENPADHLPINSGSESEIDLTGNLRASPGWIALFHLDNSANQISRWTFGTWFTSLPWRKQQSILSLNQSAMKTQQRGWLEEDGNTSEPAWPNPERAESGNQPIPEAGIGRPPT